MDEIGVSEIKTTPPVVYGELSILGYNGFIPTSEKNNQTSNGRRNKSKFLLCKRLESNGIKKSRHYIVKQPQATKAIQDKDLHSISYTFSRTQTIIVEYRQDGSTDMFQIGRSSEDPIDFIVTDTVPVIPESCDKHHHSKSHHSRSGQHNENNTNGSQVFPNMTPDNVGFLSSSNRYYRQLAKMSHNNDLSASRQNSEHHNRNVLENSYAVTDGSSVRYHRHGPPASSALLLNYPHFDNAPISPMIFPNSHRQGFDPSAVLNHRRDIYYGQPSRLESHHQRPSGMQLIESGERHTHNDSTKHCQSRHHNINYNCKRSHASQSTISRFACRILVDREPPYTARIYAAGFDSSKNIFLGEKATKWEHEESIDGLTTNGVLLMHPRQEHHDETNNSKYDVKPGKNTDNDTGDKERTKMNSKSDISNASTIPDDITSYGDLTRISDGKSKNEDRTNDSTISNIDTVSNSTSTEVNMIVDEIAPIQIDDSNNNKRSSSPSRKSKTSRRKGPVTSGGVWREVSVDGGIYAIREIRSAAQKGIRIEDESNVLQDGTLIDLCGATLLWRSVQGFMAAPTKKSLEEKIDQLNATRPQCPVGLNTLVIPRKPVHTFNTRQHRSHKDNHNFIRESIERSHRKSHYPYVYLKCGHVQGYHDWGVTDKLNQRTCPICMNIGTVARLSIGLEPSFYVDSGPLTHAFNPCGHMASEKTVRYWCSIKIPHGTNFFHSICPFCATPLATEEPASIRLIFQHDLE